MWQFIRHAARMTLLATAILPCAAAAGPGTSQVPVQAQQFEDPAQPLVPKTARSEADRDRLEAVSLFAAGRALDQQQNFAGALRRYQRAIRRDPNAVAVLREIVPLAFTLNRQSEAVRYALILAERESSDPMLLLQLGRYITEEGDWARAVSLYERALALQEKEKESVTKVKLRMELGRLCFLAKEYAKAADAFAKVSDALERPNDYGMDALAQKELTSDGGLTHELFGETFLEAGRFPEAKAAFEKADKIAPNPAALAYNLARVLARDGKSAEALEKLPAYFDAKESSRGLGPYDLLAKLFTDSQQEDAIIGRLEKLQAADPDNLPLAFSLARRYQEAGKLDLAEPIYAKLLANKPSLELFEALTQIYRQNRQADSLLTLLAAAIKKTGTLEALGAARKELVGDAASVQAVLDAARAKYKEDPASLAVEAKLAAGLLALDARQFDAAAEFLNLALEQKPANANEVLLSWGLDLFIATRYDDAANTFQRGVDASAGAEESAPFYFYLAGSLEMSGQTDAALVAAKKAAELRPKSARFQSRIPWILYHAKRHEDGRREYTELIAKFDSDYENDESRDVLREARLSMSNLSVLASDMTQAEEWLEQVLDEFPDDVGALNDLGYVWTDQGKHLERALRMLTRAVAAEPKNAAYRDSLGWCLFKLGRLPEALSELTTAADSDSDGVILDHLGDVQAKLNDTEGAVASWQRAAEAFEKHKESGKLKATQAKIENTKKK